MTTLMQASRVAPVDAIEDTPGWLCHRWFSYRAFTLVSLRDPWHTGRLPKRSIRYDTAVGKSMRLRQAILILSTLLASWLGMQAVHELGHVLAAGITGGRVARVVLHPLTISRTDVAENPHPLLVVWAGPICGVLLPLLLWACVSRFKPNAAFLPRFFAGFCLLANGLYISIGSLDRVGDCGEMLKHGSPVWLLWGFGLLTVPCGLWLWHGQGARFGWGSSPNEVNQTVTVASLIIACTLLAFSLFIGGR